MLDELRRLFLSAFQCDSDYKAELLVDLWNEEIKRIQKMYDRMTSKATTVKHGKWIKDEFGSKCSSCNLYAYRDKFDKPWESPYCPNCGAKMYGGNDE